MTSLSEIVTRARLRQTQQTPEGLRRNISGVYDFYRFRGAQAPPLHRGPRYPRIRHTLMDWKADLGARHLVDWPGFLRRHRALLQPLAALPPLGRLTAAEIDRVCEAVVRLDAFKGTTLHLVFGSKAAHFHFPALVPIMSSDVERALRWLQDRFRSALPMALGPSESWFGFATPTRRRSSYQNYVRLGNYLMRNVDERRLRGGICPAAYPLHAALLDACMVSLDPRIGRGPGRASRARANRMRRGVRPAEGSV